MAQFRKRPVVIEAEQWTGNNNLTIAVFIEQPLYIEYEDVPVLIIRTLEGDMRASVGDWIIKGVKGEFYPCKPDIFEATYSREEVPV